MIDSIKAELNRSAETISAVNPEQIQKVADLIVDAIRGGHKVIFMGNGGSSADAQHIAAEFSGKYMMDRPAMPGLSLSNIAPVTAIGNDYTYDLVFKRQIEAYCTEGDIVVGLSTSGNSKNVILAMEEAKERGAKTVSFTGDCGKMKGMADVAVVIPSTETARIQEAYLCACHIVCGIVERRMFGRRAIFVDRDDTIAKDVPYCDSPDKFHLYEGVPEAIARLNAAGFKVIMITNQSGINRGYFTLETLEAIHSKIHDELGAVGAVMDDIFFCPHRPDENCSCRKPAVGMGLAAMAKHNIDPYRSYMIGDSEKDIEFGRRIGCRTVRVGSDYTFVQAVDDILEAEGSSGM